MQSASNKTTIGDHVSPETKVIESLVLSVIIVVSVVGNLSLWIIILRSRALRTITSMFILGLSSADLLVATVNMPLTVYTVIVGHWSFSDSACVGIGFMNMLTLVSSVMSLCNISINRFFMVCRPSKFKDIYTTRNAILMIIATFTCSILLSSPPLFGWSSYVYTDTHSFCFADWVNQRSYAYFMIICCFGIPFSVMTVCNIFILRSVRQSRRKVKSTYRATISSAIISKDDREQEKSENTSSVERDYITEIVLEKNCNNFQTQSVSFRDNNVVQDVNTDPVLDMQLDTSTHVRSSRNEVMSDESSTDSNCKLLSNVGKRSPQRNKLFSDENPNRLKLKPMLKPEDVLSKAAHSNVDQNCLHPQWKPSLPSETSAISDKPSSIDLMAETSVSVATSTYVSESKKSDTINETPQLRTKTPKLRRREEIRLALSLIIVVLVFVICWLPYCISMLLSIHYDGYIPREFHMFTLLIGYANSGCNPIIYGVMNQRFKIGFKRIFCFWKTHRLSLSSSS